MVLEVRMVISCEMEKTLLADKWHERIFWKMEMSSLTELVQIPMDGLSPLS